MKYKYNPPSIIKKFYSDIQWESSTDKILLTFDDSPTPEVTPVILNSLYKFNLKAVFFCVGNNVKNHKSLCEEILTAGHTIGNHTYNHARLTNADDKTRVNELVSCKEIIKEKLNYEVKYFRPPYGKFNSSVRKIVKENKLTNVMWSLLTYDYTGDFNLVKTALTKYLCSNSIVVLHDNIKTKNIAADSIKLLKEKADEKGYKIGEPLECLR
jgi:peptidoglycan-N-acetylglucosamine deacetylase